MTIAARGEKSMIDTKIVRKVADEYLRNCDAGMGEADGCVQAHVDSDGGNCRVRAWTHT